MTEIDKEYTAGEASWDEPFCFDVELRFLTALVTWDHQRDIWRSHFYLKNATVQFSAAQAVLWESFTDETVVIVMLCSAI